MPLYMFPDSFSAKADVPFTDCLIGRATPPRSFACVTNWFCYEPTLTVKGANIGVVFAVGRRMPQHWKHRLDGILQ